MLKRAELLAVIAAVIIAGAVAGYLMFYGSHGYALSAEVTDPQMYLVNNSTLVSFQVVNDGTVPIDSIAIALNGALQTNTTVLQTNSDAVLHFTFPYTPPGTYSAEVSIHGNGATTDVPIQLIGVRGTQSASIFDSSIFVFPPTSTGTNAVLDLKINNTGTLPIVQTDVNMGFFSSYIATPIPHGSSLLSFTVNFNDYLVPGVVYRGTGSFTYIDGAVQNFTFSAQSNGSSILAIARDLNNGTAILTLKNTGNYTITGVSASVGASAYSFNQTSIAPGASIAGTLTPPINGTILVALMYDNQAMTFVVPAL